VIVHDRYPAYITWATFERIQAIVDDNYATYEQNKRRGIPRQGAALLQGLVYCGRCGHKMVVQYKGGNQYLCNALRWQAQDPVCQRLRADPVDQQVVGAFFEALARLNSTSMSTPASSAASSRSKSTGRSTTPSSGLNMRPSRRAGATRRSTRPTAWWRRKLEQRWEAALQALQEAREQYARLQRRPEQAQESVDVPPDLREAFRSLGQALPTLWPQDTFSRAQRKALLRCLIDKVVLDRRAPDTIAARIVWRGGAVSDLAVLCTVGRLVDLSDFRQLEAQILRLESQGKADEEIAQILTAKGFARLSTRNCSPARCN